MIENKERFFTINQDLEFRAQVDETTGKRTVIGYAAIYNSPSREMVLEKDGVKRKFTERIETDAFADCDFSECIYNIEHKNNRAIGRINRNLSLSSDTKGLFFKLEFETEERSTTEQNDFIKNVQQGILTQCSFNAHVSKESYHYENNRLIRSIQAFDYCLDVCSTVMGAYPETWLIKRNVSDNAIIPEPEPKEEPQPEQPTAEVNEIEVIDSDFEFFGLA